MRESGSDGANCKRGMSIPGEMKDRVLPRVSICSFGIDFVLVLFLMIDQILVIVFGYFN